MPDYEKMYHLLFNSITLALGLMERDCVQGARYLLEEAQRNAEELYLSSDPS